MDDLLTLMPLSALRVISEKCGNTEDAPDSLPPMFTWSGDTFWVICQNSVTRPCVSALLEISN